MVKMDEWMEPHTHSDHRGQRVPGCSPHTDPGAPRPSPSGGRQHCSWPEQREVRRSPQGSKPQCICVPWKTTPWAGGAEDGASSESCSDRLHSTRHKHTHAHVSTSACTLRRPRSTSRSSKSVSRVAPCHGRKPVAPLLSRLCPLSVASRGCVSLS